jgi:hypothetical protein
MDESGTRSSLLDQLLDSAHSRPLAMIGWQQGPGAAPVPAVDDIQMPPGAWGIGVSQEVRPEGISYKVRVCVHGQARYLGRWVGRVCQVQQADVDTLGKYSSTSFSSKLKFSMSLPMCPASFTVCRRTSVCQLIALMWVSAHQTQVHTNTFVDVITVWDSAVDALLFPVVLSLLAAHSLHLRSREICSHTLCYSATITTTKLGNSVFQTGGIELIPTLVLMCW